jgi:hypothetical protein
MRCDDEATLLSSTVYSATLVAYSVCNLCECHVNHNNCSLDHDGTCGEVGSECFLHEGVNCEYGPGDVE